jgi:threonine dehydrogenase-like Zn-dependent dehydrogenase
LTTGLWGASRVIAEVLALTGRDRRRRLHRGGRLPHSFTFAQMDEAYDVFSNAAENSALKVVITPG